MAKNTVSYMVKKIVALECGLKSVTNSTKFMSNKSLSYFDCMAALYTLQHRLHVCLPESDFSKYETVGTLARCVAIQLKQKNK